MRRCGHFLYQRQGGQGQRRVLTILQERGSMQQRELQEYLGIQPGSMSELIGKLEQKGLLKRTSSEDSFVIFKLQLKYTSSPSTL